MSGLLKDELLNEIRVEISWLKTAVADICDELKLSSYVSCLIKNHIEPEESAAIERVIFQSFKDLDRLSFEDLRSRIIASFEASYHKTWSRPDHLLQELIELKIAELKGDIS